MARNIKHMSNWARNLVIKVRSEISRGIPTVGAESNLGPRDGNNWELDQHYKDILKDKEQRIIDEETYRRLMGSSHEQKEVGGGKFALNEKNKHGIYTGPLTYEEIETIKDITEEAK